MRRNGRWAARMGLLAAFCVPLAPAQAERSLVLGILAVEPVEVAEERWQPLLDYLDDELDDVRIRGVIADYTELEEQLRHNRLDFLLTNPSHYIRFRSESTLSGALATLVPEHQGMAVRGFGGVAFTRAGRDDLSGWADVPGQRVAAVREISLGGYQAQAMELRERGLELPRDEHLDFVGMPHDRVVDAVMSGAADVGFVRIGVLERLWESGELARDAVRILEEEALPGFPLTLSTRLYPEWPFVALNHAEPEVGRRVLVALLRLDADDPAARAAGIAGFSVPRDYAPVEELVRELRLPPYETPPDLRWREFWELYRIPMVLLGVALVGLSAMAFGLQVANRRRRRAQQQAEENAFALADSERQARALIRALPDTLFRIDIDGTFLDCEVNDESALLMPREAFIGQKLGVLFPAEYVEQAMEAIRRALSTGEVAWYEYTTEALGRVGHFEARVVPLDAREVLMIVRDVSQRRAMEEEQRAARRFRENLLASLGEGVFGIDTRGCYTFLNPMACRLLGFPDEEGALGLDSHATSHHSRVDGTPLPKDECPIQGVLERGEPIEAWEDAFWNREDHAFPVLVYAAPLHDQNGVIEGAVVSFQDISRRKATEDELRRSNAELEQFAYAISHDMRQPLRMVSSYLQLLERSIGESLDDDQRRFFDHAVDGARRMDTMIVGLLEYSRVGRKTDPLAPLDTRETLDTALAFLRPMMDESGGEVRVEGDWPELVASRDEMVRLFQNLVGNALKYVPAGTRPAITVASRVTPEVWEVRIADNGVGVDPAQKDRLFQVFSRLHTREEYEGSGIGLALCRRIVEHHGGTIGVESEGPGSGSTFWFRIPRAGGEAPDDE